MDNKKAQAVCVNAGIKIDPKMTIITSDAVGPVIDIEPGAGMVSQDVNIGESYGDTLRILGSAPRGDGVAKQPDATTDLNSGGGTGGTGTGGSPTGNT